MKFPNKKYEIILADPPWKYRVHDKEGSGQGVAAGHYTTMTTKEIMALPVKDIAADNCALFLWITCPNVVSIGKKVLDAWGFEYVTVAFVWVKLWESSEVKQIVLPGDRKKYIQIAPRKGLGHWTRSGTELCLLGRKGRLRRADKNIDQLIFAPVTKHSAKPEDQYSRIEALLGATEETPKIELFARQRVAGWDGWGLEYPSQEGR